LDLYQKKIEIKNKKMRTEKLVTIALILFLILSCSAQQKTTEIIKGISTNTSQVSYNNEIYFFKNSLQLDSIKKSKELLDYFGRAIKNGGADLSSKYSVLLGVYSNEKEIKQDKYLDSKRVVFILNYLKEKYDIDSKIFLINFFSTSTDSSFIFLTLIDKVE
jgi:hypothetical protein